MPVRRFLKWAAELCCSSFRSFSVFVVLGFPDFRSESNFFRNNILNPNSFRVWAFSLFFDFEFVFTIEFVSQFAVPFAEKRFLFLKTPSIGWIFLLSKLHQMFVISTNNFD